MGRSEREIVHQFSAQFGYDLEITARAVERGHRAGMTVNISAPNAIHKELLWAFINTFDRQWRIRALSPANHLVKADRARGEYTIRFDGWKKVPTNSATKIVGSRIVPASSATKRYYFIASEFHGAFNNLVRYLIHGIEEERDKSGGKHET